MHPSRRTTLVLGLATLALAACGHHDRDSGDLHPGETPEMRAKIKKWSHDLDVPEHLMHRVVKRESGYNPAARNGPYYGLMQILPATAHTRSITDQLGYDVAGRLTDVAREGICIYMHLSSDAGSDPYAHLVPYLMRRALRPLGRLADAVLICTQDRMHAEPAEAFAALPPLPMRITLLPRAWARRACSPTQSNPACSPMGRPSPSLTRAAAHTRTISAK